jgi:simple sugar transport system ATP-binding protein
MAGATPIADAPAIELLGVTKRFGSIMACDSVDFAMYAGEIHGVLGENGAGKSTLMKTMIGLVLPDGGHIEVGGQPVTITDPHAAADLGIGMVHQHFSLVEPLTVWENVVLGSGERLDRNRARSQVAEIGQRYGLDVDPDAPVSRLTAGQRQRVEIIKCLRRKPRIIILDEPTSVLSPSESAQLFEVLRRVVRQEGRAVALVSHKLDEILAATDRMTIMRAGRVASRMVTAETDAPSMARAMVGRNVSLRSEGAALGATGMVAEAASQHPTSENGATPVILRITDAVVRSADGALRLDRLSLEVRAGEIVGVAGVEGNGQRELADVLSSLIGLESGVVEVCDQVVVTGEPGSMWRAGVGVIPEDRHDSGVVLSMSVAENLVMTHPDTVARRGVIDRVALRDRARELIDRFGILTPGPDAPMWSLSGGNQQRVVLARELSAGPKALVASQPTRGLDVGAIEYVDERIRQAAAEGMGILLISTELEEILDLAHRIVVISRGRVAGEMSRGSVDIEQLGLLMGGVTV